MKLQKLTALLLVFLTVFTAIPMMTSAADADTAEYIWYQDFNEPLTDFEDGKGFYFKHPGGISFADGAMVSTVPASQSFIDWQAGRMAEKPTVKETVTVHLRFKPDDLMLTFGTNALIAANLGNGVVNYVYYRAGVVSLGGSDSLFTSPSEYANIDLQLIYDAENGYYNRTVLFLNGEKVAEKELTDTTATQLKMLRCFNLYTAATYRLDEWWIAKGQTVSEKTGRYYFAKPLTSITALGNTPADNEYLRALKFGNDVPVTVGVADVSKANFTNGTRGFFDLVFKEQLRKQPIAETVTFSLKLNPYQTSLKTNNFLGFGCGKLAEKDNLIRINGRKVGIATDTTAKSFTYSEAIPADAFTAIDVAFTYDGTKFVEMTLYVGGKSIGSLDISSLNFTSLYGFRFLNNLTGDCSFKDLKVRAGVYINDTTTALLGYQCTNVYEMTVDGAAKQVYDLRIVAEIPAEALTDITKAGLLITMAVDGKTYSFTHEATVCYDSVIARDGHGEVKDVHAKEGTKLIALTLCGIPEGVRHSFRVQSFYERNGTSVSNIGSFDLSGAIR